MPRAVLEPSSEEEVAVRRSTAARCSFRTSAPWRLEKHYPQPRTGANRGPVSPLTRKPPPCRRFGTFTVPPEREARSNSHAPCEPDTHHSLVRARVRGQNEGGHPRRQHPRSKPPDTGKGRALRTTPTGRPSDHHGDPRALG